MAIYNSRNLMRLVAYGKETFQRAIYNSRNLMRLVASMRKKSRYKCTFFQLTRQISLKNSFTPPPIKKTNTQNVKELIIKQLND